MGRILETALALLLTATYITTRLWNCTLNFDPLNCNSITEVPGGKPTWLWENRFCYSQQALAVQSGDAVTRKECKECQPVSEGREFLQQQCDPNDRNLKACTLEDEMNKTACLMIECCFKDRIQNSCFHKTIDRPLQVLIILGIGILSVFIVVFCPFLCCLAAQRTKINSLLRKNKDVEEAKLKDMKVGAYVFSLLKKQKKRQKLTKGKKQSSYSEDP